ncbi:NADPH:quinone reductase [Ligilactobacillus salitolerans]|uniref:NADPH:quinone reductase n=1 Tax=Ligilactobacillus salitolerans TaxID=1808352 RepID=A0A401IPT8_9LACO|nr:zinc-binding dehydrogenase [Ligilactobacillus salitolerans]GBG93551.1 NADPH:quinone reductase [Ligilactobacillus salitolerans]
MKALYFNKFGDNSVLKYGDVDTPQVDNDQILVKTAYSGLNFADIYRRRGTYHIEKHKPYINGYEGLGTVIVLGEKVKNFKLNDKIFFVDVPLANAEYVCVPVERAIKVPHDLNPELVASIGLQGLTADFLAHDLAQNVLGDRVLIHGISGGVGQILAQMLTADGINVYGVTSTQEKRSLALKQGAQELFLRNSSWLEDNKGRFQTVYDGVGKTIEQSLLLTAKRGKVIFYGMAGGNPPQIDLLQLLNQSKSILTGDLWDYLTDSTQRNARAQRLFKYFQNNKIQISSPTIFPLSKGKEAYAYLESGQSTGKVLLKL